MGGSVWEGEAMCRSDRQFCGPVVELRRQPLLCDEAVEEFDETFVVRPESAHEDGLVTKTGPGSSWGWGGREFLLLSARQANPALSRSHSSLKPFTISHFSLQRPLVRCLTSARAATLIWRLDRGR